MAMNRFTGVWLRNVMLAAGGKVTTPDADHVQRTETMRIMGKASDKYHAVAREVDPNAPHNSKMWVEVFNPVGDCTLCVLVRAGTTIADVYGNQIVYQPEVVTGTPWTLRQNGDTVARFADMVTAMKFARGSRGDYAHGWTA